MSHFEWIRKVGAGQDSIAGLATDRSGNSYLVGNTRSADFPLKLPLQPTLASAAAADIFIVKLDPSGNVIYSTCYGGTGDDAATAVAIDPQGNLYVSGLTHSSDFPTTAGAFQRAMPAPGPSAQNASSFLFKINSDGTLGYSTFFAPSESSPKAMAVDGAGSVYITGPTTGGLPVTPGA
jgi:hypothetical protein